MIAATLVLAARDAVAEKPEWTRLFDKALELKATDREAACALFQRSFELNPNRSAGTVANLAECQEKRGRLARAWQLYIEAADLFERENPQHVQTMRDAAASVASRATTVVIAVPEPDADGLTITLNGVVLETEREIRHVVDSGEIVLVAKRAGRRELVVRRDGIVGDTIEIAVAFEATTKPAQTSQTKRRKSRVVLGIGVGVGGLAGILGGVALGLTARGRYDDLITCEPSCDDNERRRIDDAQRLGNLGTGFGIAGLVLAVSGVVIIATAPKDVIVAPTVTATSAGISLSARF